MLNPLNFLQDVVDNMEKNVKAWVENLTQMMKSSSITHENIQRIDELIHNYRQICVSEMTNYSELKYKVPARCLLLTHALI